MSGRFALVRRLFETAQELTGEERGAFLEAHTASDPSLRQELEDLLAASESAGEFLQRPAIPLVFQGVQEVQDEVELPEGYEIGAYRIVRPVARGGFGVVYLAERADDSFEKVVAIKVIKRGMDTVAVIARFRSECQILASLDHPNIARLLDGGTTKDGLPYFVMEYIEGRTLVSYCSERGLGIKGRLELFCAVCGAVAYAHRHLVVHRDLKPANILVTGDGTPKLLDFGLAKVLFPGPAETVGASTSTGHRALTPDYASPEQVRGAPITTASDVYSLGVVLFELICGTKPFPTATRSPFSPGSPPRGQKPLPPRASAKLPKDLESIVLMAMREEPERRYQTVDELAADVRRHLRGLPVSARRDTLSYRMGRFLKRNRVGVGATALVMLSLLSGFVATVWQARVASRERARAERRYRDLRQLASSLLVEFDDAIGDLPGATPARGILIKRAIEYLTALESEVIEDPSLRREVALAFSRMGELQGQSYGLDLGDVEGALRSFRRSLEIREELVGSFPASVVDRDALADCHVHIAQILGRMGDWRGHLEHARRGAEIRAVLVRERPLDPALRAGLAAALQTLGNALYRVDDHAGALEAFGQLVELRDDLSAAAPEDATASSDLAAALRNLGLVKSFSGDDAGAHASWERALTVQRALVDAYPGSVRHRTNLARTHRQIGIALFRRGQRASGLVHLREALALGIGLRRDNRNNALVRQGLAETCRDLGEALVAAGERDEARGVLSRGVRLLEPWSAKNPLNVRVRRTLAQTLRRMALAHEPTGDAGQDVMEEWTEALRWYRRSEAIWSRLESEGQLAPFYVPGSERTAEGIRRCEEALQAR